MADVVDDPALASSTYRHAQGRPQASFQSSPDTRGVPTLPVWQDGERHETLSSDGSTLSDSDSSGLCMSMASDGVAPPYPQATAGIADAADSTQGRTILDRASRAGPSSSTEIKGRVSDGGLTGGNGAKPQRNNTQKLPPDAGNPQAIAGSVSSSTTGNAQSSDNRRMFSTRGRFRRQRSSITTDESKSALRQRFWEGVKPARTNSTLLAPQGGSGVGGLTMATVRAAIKLKKRANVIHAKSVLNKYIMDPGSPRMGYWKNWMVVNIMYTVLVVPWRISFHAEAGAFGLALSAIANVSFVVDTILRFFVAIPTESGLVTDHKVIVRRYLRSWFIVDAVTCLPLTTLLRASVPRSVRVLTPMRALRLLSLLKVVKVYAMHYEVS